MTSPTVNINPDRYSLGVMMNNFIKIATLILSLISMSATAQSCGPLGVWLQVLGSGGPEVGDKRASSSYLIWHNGHARVLVDFGAGALLRFEEANAHIEDIAVIAFTHFHVDHSSDFPALIKASYFTPRTTALPLLGPSGNALLPSPQQFVSRLFNQATGVWPYLSNHLTGDNAYPIHPLELSNDSREAKLIWHNDQISMTGIGVHHGPLPALAWRVDIDGHTVVFSGDMSGQYGTLEQLAHRADLLVAHNAIPETARGVARRLHMPPSVIGKIAHKASVKQLVIAHRMRRTLERKETTLRLIRQHYQQPVYFSNDLDCYAVP